MNNYIKVISRDQYACVISAAPTLKSPALPLPQPLLVWP